ncbi:hypothetical protein D557_1598 [Bordetella holmesii 70147]|nr:hypothetical protein D560_2342 [Bordetella holmesii ATCC 51541]EWM51736.1 hypothetical protein D557_1598 [Bordetella holmesii 70147]
MATHKPSGKRRPGEVEHLLKWCLPVDSLSLFTPEGVPFVQGPIVEIPGSVHACLLLWFDCSLVTCLTLFWLVNLAPGLPPVLGIPPRASG